MKRLYAKERLEGKIPRGSQKKFHIITSSLWLRGHNWGVGGIAPRYIFTPSTGEILKKNVILCIIVCIQKIFALSDVCRALSEINS